MIYSQIRGTRNIEGYNEYIRKYNLTNRKKNSRIYHIL